MARRSVYLGSVWGSLLPFSFSFSHFLWSLVSHSTSVSPCVCISPKFVLIEVICDFNYRTTSEKQLFQPNIHTMLYPASLQPSPASVIYTWYMGISDIDEQLLSNFSCYAIFISFYLILWLCCQILIVVLEMQTGKWDQLKNESDNGDKEKSVCLN